MGDGGPGGRISQADLARIRGVVDEWLRENLEGEPRSMLVIFTTMHAVSSAIQGGPGKPVLPPDPRPVYTVVLEGTFSLREHLTRTGDWAAIHVLPSFEVRGIRLGLRELLPGDFDLDDLGPAYRLV